MTWSPSLGVIIVLSALQLGQSQINGMYRVNLLSYLCLSCKFSVERVAVAVYEVLSPAFEEIKKDISCLKSEIANLSETVTFLSEEVADIRNKTATERDVVDSAVAHLQSSLQYMIDNPATEALSDAVVVGLLRYMNDMEYDIKTEVRNRLVLLDEKMCLKFDMINMSMRDGFYGVKTELNLMNESLFTEISALQSSFNSAKVKFDREFSSLGNKMAAITSDLTVVDAQLRSESQLVMYNATTQLNAISNMTQKLCETFEDHESDTTTQLVELKQNLLTHVRTSTLICTPYEFNSSNFICNGTFTGRICC